METTQSTSEDDTGGDRRGPSRQAKTTQAAIEDDLVGKRKDDTFGNIKEDTVGDRIEEDLSTTTKFGED